MSSVNPIQATSEFLAFTFNDTDSCPTCEQPIPIERLATVKGRYAARERELTTAIAAQFERLRSDDQAKAAHELEEAKRASANAIAKVQADAKANEERIRAQMEESFQQRWDAQLATVQQAHAAAMQEREVASATQLANAVRDREENERDLKDQLATAQKDHASLSAAAVAAAAQVEQVKLEAQQAQESLRAEMGQQMDQRLIAQAAEIGMTHKTEMDAALAKLAQAARDQQAAVDAANAESQRREAAAETKLAEALAKLTDAEAAKTAAAALVEQVRLEAQQAQEGLRAEMDRQMNQRLTAQAAASATTHKTEMDAVLAQLAQAASDQQAAIDAANTAAETKLAAAQTRLTEAEAEKTALEEQVRSADATKAAEVAQVREAMEADKRNALLAEQSKRFEETQKLSADLDDLRRKLEKKTADELGEGAELVLFEELKRAFPSDLITEVKRGQQGADIIHEVRMNGIVVGKLIYDSKNRKDWKFEYATKLRTDQIAERADHAILSTNKFPTGTRQLHTHDHVIIACPARVLVLATLLREQIITMHTLRISNEERDEKTAKLYAFITSARFTQLIETVNTQLAQLEKIETDERKAHDAVWLKRGKTFKAMEKANGDLRFEVSRIVGVLPTVALNGEEADE